MRIARLIDRTRRQWIAGGLAGVSLLYYLGFLIHHGVMFRWNCDLIANAAYGVTLFSKIHQAGWTVPKPADMLIFGGAYALADGLWGIHLVLIVATALTVYAACRVLLDWGQGAVACVAFTLLILLVPEVFEATLEGGQGLLNASFLFLALLAAARWPQRPYRLLLIVFLSFANLARPDAWPATYLLIAVLLGLRFHAARRIRLCPADAWFLIPIAMPLVWFALNWSVFGDPLYSWHIVRAFLAEGLRDLSVDAGPRGAITSFLPRLQSTIGSFFILPDGWSLPALGIAALIALGVVSLVQRARSASLLLACVLLGPLLFYAVYALRGVIFMSAYLYVVMLVIAFLVAAGIGSVSRLALRLPHRGLRAIGAAVLTAALLLSVGLAPARQIYDQRLHRLEINARLAELARPAIERLLADAGEHAGPPPPLLIGSRWVPTTWISLARRSGEGVLLLERLMGQEAGEAEGGMPDLEGRTVYFCVGQVAPPSMRAFIQPFLDEARDGEVIFQEDGIVIVRCHY